ncbi:HAD family hydrolase [Altererythrobacter sp. ZODW24]|uniref:HAD family hydrolase n=1 Tax=Altererythrobacter sp. ZODW24 TaxID=2185142 RepID=UPI000DF82E37|nr:HAD family hydrolase [Altererythrobacter sp. ZODW24]
MTKFPFDIVGFDLDGTLLDTHQDLGAAVNHALAIAGRPEVPIGQIEGLIGGGAKIMLKKALEDTGGIAEGEFRPLYKALLAYYSDNNAVHSRPYPGVVEALDALAERGVKMAVVTNKFESFATKILTELGLADRFETIIGGDTMGKGRAKPEPYPIIEMMKRLGGGRTVFIGDSSYDIAAAKAADVPSVAAAFGYCNKPPHELGADAIITGFDALIETLEGL